MRSIFVVGHVHLFLMMTWLTSDFSANHIICIGLLGLLALESQDLCLFENDIGVILLAITVSILEQRWAADQVHHIATASFQICFDFHKLFLIDKTMRKSGLGASRDGADPIRPALGHQPSEVHSFVDNIVELLGQDFNILARGGIS